MSDDPTSSGTPGAGRWAERAKAAARQRQAEAAAAPAKQERVRPKHRLFKSTPEQPATAAPGPNPFLPGTASSGNAGADLEELGSEERGKGGLADLGLGHVTGPVDPPVASAPLNPALTVPVSWPATPAGPGPQGTLVQLVGLHGGAGTSTLAALLGPQATDCGTSLENLATVTTPVLFVTRSHAHGLDLALRIGQQHAARALEPLMVLGICVVYDAPHLSQGLARTLRSVQKTLPNCWTVKWDEDLRHDPALPPAASKGQLVRDVRRILKKASQLRESREPPPGRQSHSQNL